MSHSQGTALITGASRGIGAVYADRLVKRGYDLLLVARDEARLKAFSARLTNETGRSITPLPADLNDEADRAKVEAKGTCRTLWISIASSHKASGRRASSTLCSRMRVLRGMRASAR